MFRVLLDKCISARYISFYLLIKSWLHTFLFGVERLQIAEPFMLKSLQSITLENTNFPTFYQLTWIFLQLRRPVHIVHSMVIELDFCEHEEQTTYFGSKSIWEVYQLVRRHDSRYYDLFKFCCNLSNINIKYPGKR